MVTFQDVAPVWDPIVDELCRLQNRADPDGAVYHPVGEFSSTFDTACSAQVFATAYALSDDEIYCDRAAAALSAIDPDDVYTGVDEPRWDPIDWHLEEGSPHLTGVVFEALWETRDLLDRPQDIDAEHWRTLCEYLERCRHGTGRFAHNVLDFYDGAPPDVQNTTAYSHLLLNCVDRYGSVDHPVLGQREPALSHVLDGQRADGFWPYIYPSKLQRMIFKRDALHPLITNKYVQYLLVRGDDHIFFGDTIHHCYVLYCLSRAAAVRQHSPPREALAAGWRWLDERLVETSDGIRVDFSWEPEPSRVAYRDFRDTTTYFMIPSVLPFLVEHDVVDQSRAEAVATGLFGHVSAELLREERPCIPPHEGPREIREKILPAIWNSVSWKGSLLATYLRHSRTFSLKT